MKANIIHLLEHLIRQKAFLDNYPKEPVVFLAVDHFLKDPNMRALVVGEVIDAIKNRCFAR